MTAAGAGSQAARGKATADATRQLLVWRGDAAGGGLVDYTVLVHEGEVVLDVLHRLHATQAGDLAIRWNCKAGKCGSCSAEVNGRPGLLCMTRLSALPSGPVTITPLRTFPVIRADQRPRLLPGDAQPGRAGSAPRSPAWTASTPR
jgi:succinate dehydrogenase / fumarate reductase iron-sulfur subunit